MPHRMGYITKLCSAVILVQCACSSRTAVYEYWLSGSPDYPIAARWPCCCSWVRRNIGAAEAMQATAAAGDAPWTEETFSPGALSWQPSLPGKIEDEEPTRPQFRPIGPPTAAHTTSRHTKTHKFYYNQMIFHNRTIHNRTTSQQSTAIKASSYLP